jgi:hypothetical protein
MEYNVKVMLINSLTNCILKEREQQCEVGRLSCGLPRHSTNFALLPPLIKDTIGQAVIKNAIKTVFPYLKQKHRLVGRYMLSSLLYHKEFLRSNLPSRHLLFQTTLFKNQTLFNLLKVNFFLKYLGPCSLSLVRGQPSGIPSDILLSMQIDEAP